MPSSPAFGHLKWHTRHKLSRRKIDATVAMVMALDRAATLATAPVQKLFASWR